MSAVPEARDDGSPGISDESVPGAAGADWIGRTRTDVDTVTPRLAMELAATLGDHAARGVSPPPGIFWCLAPDLAPASGLGEDGHPRPGLFLPATGLPRRMWAGGEIAFHGELSVGDRVERTTRVDAVTHKAGRTGPLAFVTLGRTYRVDGRLVLEERQDIVYRRAEAGETPPPSPGSQAAAPPHDVALSLRTTPTLLFRYSALTFNGHRIHYDADYARQVEGYAGLVVHGPLMASLMLNLAVNRLGRLPGRFAYRGHRPVICGTEIHVAASPSAEGLALEVFADGAMSASATAVP